MTVIKKREFQSKKYIMMFSIIMIGTVAAICVHLSSLMHGRLVEGTHLKRNEWGEGNYTVTLKGTTASKEGKITFEVNERLLTEEEKELLKEQITLQLPRIIMGDNENLSAVNKDLQLVSEVPAWPVYISWKSSDYDRVRTDGSVNTANLKPEGEIIILTAVCSYEKDRWEQEIIIKLVPRILTPEEQYLEAMKEELLKNDLLYQSSQDVFLPEKIGNETVTWEEQKKNNSFLVLLSGLLGALLISLLMERGLKQRKKLRNEELIRSYPVFISKLQLYMGAGLTIRNAFLRIGKEYQEERNRTGKRRFLYEEVLISGYEFLNGKPEDMVYLEWGKRCGEMKYRKLSFLLISHLRSGNNKLLLLLSEEAELALEDRKIRAKRMGEEAGTKLLFPMMMMLIVIMLLILLPAFGGLGTI